MVQIANLGHILTVRFDQKRCNFRAKAARRAAHEVADTYPESPQLPGEYAFFTGSDPASAQVCHDRPNTGRAERVVSA